MFYKKASSVNISSIKDEELDSILVKIDDGRDYNTKDYLFFKCIVMSGDEPNENGDYFPAEELKKSYKTLLGRGLYIEHQVDFSTLIGKVIWSDWDEESKKVIAVVAVDKRVAPPEIVNGIRTGLINSVSMGCLVDECICSVCGNVAHNINELCEHMKPGSGSYVKGKRDDSGKIQYYEINRGITFQELSIVSFPADPAAKILEVKGKKEVAQAEQENELEKIKNFFKESLQKEIVDLKIELKNVLLELFKSIRSNQEIVSADKAVEDKKKEEAGKAIEQQEDVVVDFVKRDNKFIAIIRNNKKEVVEIFKDSDFNSLRKRCIEFLINERFHTFRMNSYALNLCGEEHREKEGGEKDIKKMEGKEKKGKEKKQEWFSAGLEKTEKVEKEGELPRIEFRGTAKEWEGEDLIFEGFVELYYWLDANNLNISWIEETKAEITDSQGDVIGYVEKPKM
jgi:hypothetical protein